jgi:hypothetical protein
MMVAEMIEMNDEVVSLLVKWQGGRAKLWEYTPTHSKITIRIEFSDRPGNLHIVCGGCNHICGPLSWRNCELIIERGSESGTKVLKDKKSGFELVCEVVSWLENVEPVYAPIR